MLLQQNAIEGFAKKGFLRLRGIFTEKVAKEAQERVWACVPRRDSKLEWYSKSYVHLQKSLKGPPFDAILANKRLREAIDQLLGPGRWKLPSGLGQWPLLLPRFDPKDERITAGVDPTGKYTDYGWHFDGKWGNSSTEPVTGLVGVFLFSDIGVNDGATPVLCGSHLEVARQFQKSPSNGSQEHLLKKKLGYINQPGKFEKRIVHLKGKAGDLWLFHSMLLHCHGFNKSKKKIRFAAYPHFNVKGKLCSDANKCSPFERTILEARKAL